MRANEADVQWIYDPTVYTVNRLDAVSDHKYYPDTESAALGAEMVWKQSLNGTWKFKESQNFEERPEDFFKVGCDVQDWDDIPVPAHVQYHGYDQINYANKAYQWDGVEDILPPTLPKHNPVFSYVREFELAEPLKDHKLELVFHGVETAFYVWVNGQFVGYDEDSFTPSRFDITDIVKQDGKNTIAVQVWKYSTAAWIHDQDMFRFNGIFRDVDLMAWPETHVRDLSIQPEVSENLQSARIRLQMKMAEDTAHSFVLHLYDADMQQLAEYSFDGDAFEFDMNDIHLWSAEDPYLYHLMLEVYGPDKELAEVIPQHMGLRRFEMKDGLMMLNGKRIVFHGVNRHEFKADSGHVMDEATMEWDAKFMKQNNINAVRTSHYPNQSAWYDLCDKYGLYMIDEGNLEAHGMWDMITNGLDYKYMVPGDNPDWTGTLIDRVRSMTERDKNHPAILIWSPGNESYTGTNLDAMTKFLMDRNDGRLVQYEGCDWNPDPQWQRETQIKSRMYPPAKEIEEYLVSSPDKPYINVEYMHGMGNSLGGFCKFTELEEKYPQYQGGFIWDYADQAVWYKDRYGQDVLGYGGDFKDRYAEYNFSGNGILFADRSESPKVQEVKYQYQDMKLEPTQSGVKITNKALFTNTDAYDMVYTLSKNGEVLQEGVVETHVAPGETEEVAVPWRTDVEGEVVKTVSARLKEDTAYASRGHEHAMGWKAEGKFEEVPQQSGEVRLVKGTRETGVFTGDLAVKFQEGMGITSIRFNDEEFVARPGKPQFFRAPTDNETGYQHDILTADWLAASTYPKIESMTASLNKEKDEAKVVFRYHLPAVDEECTVTYTIRYPGVITMDVDWPGKAGLPELPMFGHNFRLYPEYDQVRFYGQGPDENYIDRNDGARLGVFTTTAQENMTPYLLPQEAGNRTGVRWMEVTDQEGKGLRFTMKDKPFQASVLPYDAMTIASAIHQEELPRPYYTFVTIAGDNMGVGGDNSWGAPVLEEYCLPADEPRHFSVDITRADK